MKREHEPVQIPPTEEHLKGGIVVTYSARVRVTVSFAVLIEALNCHRGKGQQKVTVEHVTVNTGGQAIVGSPGGGEPIKPEEQPHALAYAPCTPMRSANPEHGLVPIAGDAQRSLSPTWRQIDRAAEGQ